MDFLYKCIKSGKTKAQLLVRFPPNDFVDKLELLKRPWLVYEIPGIRFSKERGVDWDMSFEDIHKLAATLANADIFICYTSSLSVDAAIFDKPVINIDFDTENKKIVSRSPRYFYKMAHYQKAIRTGGIKLPRSQEELINSINEYLENPFLDKAGRARLVSEQCWKLDGQAGQRIANFLLRESGIKI